MDEQDFNVFEEFKRFNDLWYDMTKVEICIPAMVLEAMLHQKHVRKIRAKINEIIDDSNSRKEVH